MIHNSVNPFTNSVIRFKFMDKVETISIKYNINSFKAKLIIEIYA